jgi:hypothetical protein
MSSENTGHVDIGALFEFATLKVPLDEASQAHLEDCAVCMDRLAWMQGTRDFGRDKKTAKQD